MDTLIINISLAPGAGPDHNARIQRLENQMADLKADEQELKLVLNQIKQDFVQVKNDVANILADEQRQDAKILELEAALEQQGGLSPEVKALLAEVKEMSSTNTQSVSDLAARIPEPAAEPASV